jgi:ABC-type multidrug transport system fused ATPase/permease subunit
MNSGNRVSRFKWFQQGTVKELFSLLNMRDRKKIAYASIIQVTLGVLDLFAVAIVGLLGVLSVNGLQSRRPSDRISLVLEILGISNWSFQSQVTALAIVAVCILTGRTLFSVYFTRKILFFFSRRGAEISATLISKLLSKSLLEIQSRSSQDLVFAVTRGVELIVMQVFATAVVLTADVSLLLIMTISLFILSPITALGTSAVFGTFAFALYFFMNVRAKELGLKNSNLSIQSSEKIIEVLSTYRESVVKNRRNYYSREFEKIRYTLAQASAEISFMPYISKYIIEAVIILGAIIVGTLEFIQEDAAHAVSILAVFLAAGTRLAPAILRIQQGSISIRNSLGQANPTLSLIRELKNTAPNPLVSDQIELAHSGFVPECEIKNLFFDYPNNSAAAISKISITISPRELVAIVGSSGAGKTTLADLMLGIINAKSGEILISGVSPQEAITKWPGALAYVPQDVEIIAGTIRENVALGYPTTEATDELVLRALKIACLEDFVQNLPDGMDSPVGEKGTKISGGQRQRLGIARAMFTQPNFLVLDEATSSLDGKTEADISSELELLRETSTVVVIAHRLSTIRKADKIIYLSEGKILGSGTFDELRKTIPEFESQVKLMIL